jgi:hypothetical protein
MKIMQYIRFASYQDNTVYQIHIISGQCSRSGSHHIRTTVDSLKSEHTPDWLHVTAGQLWSFKLVEDASNRFCTRLDYHSVLKDVNDFLKKAQLPTDEIYTSVYKTKMKAIGWSFYIEHIITPLHRWRRMPNKKMKQLLCRRWSRSAWFE